jgi:predicted  nucleic acid-binding Zn-ribbon protein
MRTIECSCGKSFETSDVDFIVECPYCDCIGLNYCHDKTLYKEEELKDELGNKVAKAIWLGLFDYKGPPL